VMPLFLLFPHVHSGVLTQGILENKVFHNGIFHGNLSELVFEVYV
jgi:hypothetical protein